VQGRTEEKSCHSETPKPNCVILKTNVQQQRSTAGIFLEKKIPAWGIVLRNKKRVAENPQPFLKFL
jgi:hypothetical protein